MVGNLEKLMITAWLCIMGPTVCVKSFCLGSAVALYGPGNLETQI